MGQQQLLLVILVTIIVGIATVVAINTFGAAADSANVDAVIIDAAQIAAASQGFYMKPTMLGGGSRTFEGLTFEDFAFPADALSENADIARNENGFYTIVPGDDNQSFTLRACAASNEGYNPGTITDGVLGGTACGTPVRTSEISANSYTRLAEAGEQTVESNE